MTPSARRINALARSLQARRYLEIGVAQGETFRDVAIAERTAVDPRFQFSTAGLTDERTRFCPQTSDAFFAAEPHLPAYDVVFIDGLHEFGQVARDFGNAILRTHRHSVIILDDTVPNSVYSTIQDEDAARRHKKIAGIEDPAWHGDVFRIVFYLHDFWPSLNYRTIMDAGNPQTLVWRANGAGRRPLFGDLERISRLTYFDMHDNFEVLRPAHEDEAISVCIAETIVP